MADEPRPMPRVTVSDPNRPGLPADVLVAGPEQRPADPAVRRRRLRIAGALVLAAAILTAGLEIGERRADAAQERRLGAVVQLRADHDGGSSSFEPATGTGRLTLQVVLHNDGPADLHVTDAGLAGYELVLDEVRVASGRSVPLLLERSITCGDAPPASPPGGLRLTVRTITSERRVELPLLVDQDEPARLCGFRPLDTMFVSFGEPSRPSPEEVELALELDVRARGRVQLAAVKPQPGIGVQVRVEGRPSELPVELPSTDVLTRTLTVVLRLTVTDCAAALAPPGTDLPEPDPAADLLVQLRDESGSLGDALVAYPDRLLESLISESCGEGSRAS